MESENIVLQDIFLFQQEGIMEDGHVVGKHQATGLRPRSLERFKQYGVGLKLPLE
jgi:pilus assembly protein CpaF